MHKTNNLQINHTFKDYFIPLDKLTNRFFAPENNTANKQGHTQLMDGLKIKWTHSKSIKNNFIEIAIYQDSERTFKESVLDRFDSKIYIWD